MLLGRSPLLFLVIHRRKPFGRFCVLPPFTAMAAATPAQDLVRREDSEYLVAFKEKILLSREEFDETVGSVFTDASPGGWFHWEW